jgi:U4/U6 small nuclear ribonucleoprotein PRP4
VETGKEVLTQGGFARAPYGIAFHTDGALVATGGLDAVVRLWDLRSGRSVWNMRGHAKQIIGLDISPDGNLIASGSDDHTMRIWDLRKRKTQTVVPAHNSLISSIHYQPLFGNYIVTSGYDGTCKVWSARDYSLITVLTGHEGKISDVVISPSSRGTDSITAKPSLSERYSVPIKLATTSFDRTWKLWEYDSLSVI